MVKTAFNNAVDDIGPLYLFVNCAGLAICGTLEDISTNDIMVFSMFNILPRLIK